MKYQEQINEIRIRIRNICPVSQGLFLITVQFDIHCCEPNLSSNDLGGHTFISMKATIAPLTSLIGKSIVRNCMLVELTSLYLQGLKTATGAFDSELKVLSNVEANAKNVSARKFVSAFMDM